MLSYVELWRALLEERVREADRQGRERQLLAGQGEAHVASGLAPAIVIRLCRAADDERLRRLAALDSRRLPGGSFVLAELAGEIVAAVPLDADERPLADPFRRTAEIVPLLEFRARQLLAAERAGASRRRRFRFAA